jgi:uncharacterized RDD family membrane protein YckC
MIGITCPKCGLKQLESASCKSCGTALGGSARPQNQPRISETRTPEKFNPEYDSSLKDVSLVRSEKDLFSYAGFWRRLGASLIDGMIIWIGGIIMGIILGSLIGLFLGIRGTDMAIIKKVAVTNVYIIGTVLHWLYYALLESSSRQATLGKMAIGIIVTDYDGGRISFGRASGRYWGKMVSALILMIGFIMAGFTERKQGLHDIMAGCLVLNK